MIEEIIKGVTKISNQKKIKNLLEPHVADHSDIKPWMVRRVLYSYFLMMATLNEKEEC